MKRLKITNDHGWTPRTLRKQERKIKNTLLRQRVMAVRLVMEGYLGKEAASMVNVCRQTVSHYVSLFNEGGLELLLHRDFAPGREPFLTEEQQEKIKQLVLTTTPAELGWDVASAWNTKLLQSYVAKQFGVSISREALRKLLHRKGLSWTRPTYTLAKGNPDEQKQLEKQMDLIKKLDHQGHRRCRSSVHR
ncbi:winged helix-turn-helix domain-containing protein [Anoxybacillus geothermalis]|nr:winged helix-turn-helix domain-containing protein [Anoxybacillus geothermalis]MED4923746.1 winged helix-turn-helix domain-containing protein [Anoxybacillus geothermalis]